MPKGPSGQKRPADSVARAVLIAKIATGEKAEKLSAKAMDSSSLGGKARAASLSSEQKSEIAKKAAKARWDVD